MRVLLVDDHLLFCQGLKFLLADLDPDVQCETADSIRSAIQARGPFDLVLLDYNLPDSRGHEGLQRVLSAHDEATVVMLSGDSRPELVRELVTWGASGFVSKAADTPTLLQALRVILAGGVYLPETSQAMTGETGPSPLAALTQRQMDVLLRLVQGKPNKAIARELDIAESTIKTHVSDALRILGVSNRAEAVFKAAAWGLVAASSPSA
jgi:DNA-binding NarL/FixJ family response regulator